MSPHRKYVAPYQSAVGIEARFLNETQKMSENSYIELQQVHKLFPQPTYS